MTELTLGNLATETWTIAEHAYAEKHHMRGQLKKCAAVLRRVEAELAQMQQMRDESDAAIAWLRSRSQSPTLYEAPGDVGGYVKAALARHKKGSIE